VSEQSEPEDEKPEPADKPEPTAVQAQPEVAGVQATASAPATKIHIVPETSVPADKVPTLGNLLSPVQDRDIPHFIISEVELRMLEAMPGGSEPTWLGAAIGGLITFGLADQTLSKLSAYHHAFVVMGFWVSLFAFVYFTSRVFRERSMARKIAVDVRKRPKDLDRDVQAPPGNRLRLRWPFERR
jgi:hypothetical protein